MKLNSSTKSSKMAKRLWNFIRITFFMMRKGLISKKKFLMDINLFFKRGRLIRKTVNNLLSHHHHHHDHHLTRSNFIQRDYEFSCSNSPDPVFFRVSKPKRFNHHHNHHHHHHLHLPCMNSPRVLEELESQDSDDDNNNNAIVLVPKTPEYTFNLCLDSYDVGHGESFSPIRSPFSIKISDYLSEDEEVVNGGDVKQVDHEAEEFIKNFYEQLRSQSRMQLLQY